LGGLGFKTRYDPPEFWPNIDQWFKDESINKNHTP